MIVIGTGAVAAEITMFFPFVEGYLEYDCNIDEYYNNYHLLDPILGNVDNYRIRDNDQFVFAFADIKFREKMIEKMKDRGAKFITLIHKSAIVNPRSSIGIGNVIYPQCIVSTNVKIGNFNLLTCQSIISHDCSLGNNNVLATALICGHVNIGDNNSFGIKSTVIPGINIGSDNIIQAGMVVDKNIENNSVIFYRYK